MLNAGRVPSCPICESANTREFLDVFDDRYGYPGRFRLMNCRDCGHITLTGTKFTSAELADLYTRYYPRSQMDVESHTPAAESAGFGAWLRGDRARAFRWVARNSRVLDIGCGFGESLGFHKARGCEAYGVEADSNILRVARKFGYNVRVGLFDASAYAAEFFDYVTLDQVIEHMSDPLSALRGIATVLKPGGMVIIGTPNANGWGARVFGRHWINWHAPYHLHLFSPRSMAIAARRAGLGLVQSRTVTSSEWLSYQWAHLVTFPKPGEPSAFWARTGATSRNRRVVLKAASLLHRLKINHLATRLFDAARIGDSRLYFLEKV
jgi:2-polyprenyl-3-methyl-5-hydroxy-6-metoxy-1,4-benzoquinol methylase